MGIFHISMGVAIYSYVNVPYSSDARGGLYALVRAWMAHACNPYRYIAIRTELHCAWKPLSVIPTRYSKLLRIRIWDSHTRTGEVFVPYAYGMSHTRMGHPVRVWDNIRILGRTYISYTTNSVV